MLDELKGMLLDDQNSDAFKAQCLRVAALIVSTNNPTGEAAAAPPLCCLATTFTASSYPCPLSTGDDFATKFASRSMLYGARCSHRPQIKQRNILRMYEICRLAESPQAVVHRNAVWLLAALTQNQSIIPALACCCKKLMKVRHLFLSTSAHKRYFPR